MADEIAELLRRALHGERVTTDELAEEVDCASPFGQAALHQLFHWIADEDIRRRDPTYEQVQRAELAGLLAELTATR